MVEFHSHELLQKQHRNLKTPCLSPCDRGKVPDHAHICLNGFRTLSEMSLRVLRPAQRYEDLIRCGEAVSTQMKTITRETSLQGIREVPAQEAISLFVRVSDLGFLFLQVEPASSKDSRYVLDDMLHFGSITDEHRIIHIRHGIQRASVLIMALGSSAQQSRYGCAEHKGTQGVALR